MTNSQRLSAVRECLIQWLAAQSREAKPAESDPGGRRPDLDAEPAIISESLLIRDGFFCGRRFDLGSHRAVWFLEENIVKIFRHSGELICVLSGEQLSPEQSVEDENSKILSLRPTTPPAASDVGGGSKGSDDNSSEAAADHRRAA